MILQVISPYMCKLIALLSFSRDDFAHLLWQSFSVSPLFMKLFESRFRFHHLFEWTWVKTIIQPMQRALQKFWSRIWSMMTVPFQAFSVKKAGCRNMQQLSSSEVPLASGQEVRQYNHYIRRLPLQKSNKPLRPPLMFLGERGRSTYIDSKYTP